MLRSHPGLINARGRDRSSADPFVIALAKMNVTTVVTEEGYGSPKHPEISDVRGDVGAPYIRRADLIVQQDWAFG